jgi:hypothetical protein
VSVHNPRVITGEGAEPVFISDLSQSNADTREHGLQSGRSRILASRSSAAARLTNGVFGVGLGGRGWTAGEGGIRKGLLKRKMAEQRKDAASPCAHLTRCGGH